MIQKSFVTLALFFIIDISSRASLFADALPQRSSSSVAAVEALSGNRTKSADSNLHYWKAGVIPYELSATFRSNESANIVFAMDEISRKTSSCVKFVPRKDEKDYLKIVRGFACTSHVGNTGGQQSVSLTRGCLEREKLGAIQHNFMHTLGFYHEVSRPDRDQYITVNWENIAKNNKIIFQQMSDMDTFGLPYDFESIMHYPANAYAVNHTIPTLIPKKKNVRIGQDENLSDLDVTRIRAAYKCA